MLQIPKGLNLYKVHSRQWGVGAGRDVEFFENPSLEGPNRGFFTLLVDTYFRPVSAWHIYSGWKWVHLTNVVPVYFKTRKVSRFDTSMIGDNNVFPLLWILLTISFKHLYFISYCLFRWKCHSNNGSSIHKVIRLTNCGVGGKVYRCQINKNQHLWRFVLQFAKTGLLLLSYFIRELIVLLLHQQVFWQIRQSFSSWMTSSIQLEIG